MRLNLLSQKTLLISLVACFLGGLLLQWIHNRKQNQPVDTQAFQTELHRQMSQAENLAKSFLQQASGDFYDFTIRTSNSNSITELYYYEKGYLAFWSSNEYVFNNDDLPTSGVWCYKSAGNIHALMKWFSKNDSSYLLVVLPIKKAFPYKNQYLKNEFLPVFNLPDAVTLSDKPSSDRTAITDLQGNPLFWIDSVNPIPTTSLTKKAGFLLFLLAFLAYLLLYFLVSFKPGKYLLVTFAFFIFLFVVSWFDFPDLLFNNDLFVPEHFTVNPLLKTYTHLSVILFFIVTGIYSSAIQFAGKKQKAPFYILAILYFGGVVQLLKSIIDHSASNFNIYQLSELTFINSWAHFLLFVVLAGGFGMLHLCFPHFFKLKFSIAGSYIVVATLLSLGLTHHLNQQKKFAKYQVLTENIRMNGTSIKDPAAELLLEDLSVNLMSDKRLIDLSLLADSIDILYTYIESKHLFLFKNKYDIRVTLTSPDQTVHQDYIRMMQKIGTPVGNSLFYSLPASLYESSYAGVFRLHSDKAILFEFQNKRNFRSYSFPDLIISERQATPHPTDISIASYTNLELDYSDVFFDWPENGKKFQFAVNQFARLKLPSGIFYVLQNDEQLICIRELKESSRIDKVFYFILITAIFLVLGSILITLHHLVYSHKLLTIGLTGKFQFVFIALLMISFMSTLLFSTNYFRKNYEKEQLELINSKKHYIQSSLQETFFWVNDLKSVSNDQLNIILQELAYRFQTDIHVYSLNGDLAGSSISMIFSKQLISPWLAPEIMFGDDNRSYQYEKVGQLRYLSGYIELLNGDFLPIGYIAIPQFLSQNDINLKINQFLIAVFQIFTLIILLSIVLLLIAGNRLATPLRMLEEKLKTMKINGSNSRIEYRATDEIGQLVEQYNKTVDELEKSTQLLIQSERESAWRTMARQVAHEINNPLTPMKLTIQQMQRLRDKDLEQFNEYFQKTSKTLIDQIDNLSRIAGTFSQFARLPDTQLQVMDIAERLFTTVELFKNNAEDIEITYYGVKEGIKITADPEQLTRVFINLLKNAVQAIPDGRNGKIEVYIKTINKQVLIEISDNGTGLSTEAEENIFKPNFTTKTSGMGLGLSISKAIVENAGGTIQFKTEKGVGSVFTIFLPVHHS